MHPLPDLSYLIFFLSLSCLIKCEEWFGSEKQSATDIPFQNPSEKHVKVDYYQKKGFLADIKTFNLYYGAMYKKAQKFKPQGGKEDPRVHWKVPDLIKNADTAFEVETHLVTTKDNYILTLFRIKNRKLKLNPCYYPVLFWHGFMGSSADFLLLDPEFSYPLVLAKIGYDVWLANSRGNEYSQGHVSLKTDGPRYWNFSFHEQGKYDVPAVFGKRLQDDGTLDYITENIEPTKIRVDTDMDGNPETEDIKGLHYVAHGLGTTLLYVCMTLFPIYNRLIQSMIAFGPIAFMSRSRTPMRSLIPLVKLYETFPKDGPVSPKFISTFLRVADPKLCKIQRYGRSLCGPEIFTFMADESRQTIRDEVVPRIFGHSPSTTSMKNLVHFLQLLVYDRFRQFDYGPKRNYVGYNQTIPNKYNPFFIQVRNRNFFGQRDILIERQDAEQTVSQLGTQGLKQNELHQEFNLADFLFSEAAVQNSLDSMFRVFEFATDREDEKGMDNRNLRSGSFVTRGQEKLSSSCTCLNECRTM